MTAPAYQDGKRELRALVIRCTLFGMFVMGALTILFSPSKGGHKLSKPGTMVPIYSGKREE